MEISMNILVTGAEGFIGKNLVSHLSLMEGMAISTISRGDSKDILKKRVLEADFIYHLAGVNRPENDDEFEKINFDLTASVIDILRVAKKKTPLLITSSTQAERNNLYGKSKRAAEISAFDWYSESGAPVYIYRLPGIFGKWCRPNYNSVVATFCYNIANGLPIEISDSSYIVTLAYIDDVVDEFTALLAENNIEHSNIQYIHRTFDISLGDLSDRLYAIHAARSDLIIPDLSDILYKFLYATYTSYLATDNFSYKLAKSQDERGYLTEFIKSHQFGQVFISKTKPGIARGNHWHKTKIEKFFVISGEAEITFRNKVNSQDVIRYKVSGEDMRVVDIPVGYVHAIKNIGDEDLITIFWANEILDRNNPDTYYEEVEKP